MKKPKSLLLTCCLCLIILSAFDWPIQTNTELRTEMLEYTTSFLSDYKNQPVAKPLKRFLRLQKKEKDPYKWIGETISLVSQLKKEYPPTYENEAIRKRILSLLDYPLHVNNFQADADPDMLSAYYGGVQQYLMDGKKDLFEWLEKGYQNEGLGNGNQSKGLEKGSHNEVLEVWKIYNMGFVLRTKGHTIGIDITDRHSLPEGYAAWIPEDYQRLASHLDVLFLTHPHGDHFSATLMKAMSDQGKTVVLPCPPPAQQNYIDTQTEGIVRILDSTTPKPVNVRGIEVLAFHGNQGENIPCNIYLLEMDGFRIIHNGDNYDREQESLISRYPAAHLIIGSSWNKVQSLLTAAMNAPGAKNAHQLFIPAHENELCHQVGNRESYRELFSRPDRLGNPDFPYPPTIVLDCAESITLAHPR